MAEIRKFSELLQEGIQQEKLKRHCKLGIITDEICDEVGCGSTTLYTWRKGKGLPQDSKIVEALARRFWRSWQADQAWISEFLQAGGYQDDSVAMNRLLAELFVQNEPNHPQAASSLLPKDGPSTKQAPHRHQPTETSQMDSSPTIHGPQSQTRADVPPQIVWVLGGIIILLLIGFIIMWSDFFHENPPTVASTPEVLVGANPIDLPESANHCPEISLCASFLSSLDTKSEKRFVSPIPVVEKFTGFYWNDRIEKIILPPDACVEIWEHDEFKGDSEIICNESSERVTFDLKLYLREVGPNKGTTWMREATSYQLWWIES